MDACNYAKDLTFHVCDVAAIATEWFDPIV